MSEAPLLAGRVVAILGTGSELDRAVAVACAEAGADIALGTESDARDQDYGMNSIANEIWAIGREHLVRVLKGPDNIGDFVRDTGARLGGCDVLVCRFELSEVEGVPVVQPSALPELTLHALLERFAG